MVKIAIPIEYFDGEASPISPHFGRAPAFALATLTREGLIESLQPVPNTGGHFGGHGAAEALALSFNVDALVVKGMGPRGLQAFQEKGVTVLTGAVNRVGEALAAYRSGRLVVLTQPCREARHR
ncbi:MAG: NifB/NifX family molybdenum-iron cluster-binding protein [Candidatus Bathyarchaeia archaeon]